MTPEQVETRGMATIKSALDQGINFLDTAWIYQNFAVPGGADTNEGFVGKAIKEFGRDKFVIATKFGIGGKGPDSSEAFIRNQLSESLKRLDIDCIDLYYQHRPDPNTPIEEVMEVLKALHSEGKIKYAGLSECTGDELRRAHAVFPVTAIQMEWSLQTRDLEATVVPVARELGVAIVAYSPLGRGMLSDTFKSAKDVPAHDWRAKETGRFAGDNLQKNIDDLSAFKAFAEKKGCTPAQLSLAWLLAQGDDVFPIPGTKNPERVVENAATAQVVLSKEEADQVAKLVPQPKGDRYNVMASTFNARV